MMEIKLSPKNPRIAVDEMGNELLEFKGLHLSDWRRILAELRSTYVNPVRPKDIEI